MELVFGRVGIRKEKEKFRDGDSYDGGGELRDKGITWLGEGG